MELLLKNDSFTIFGVEIYFYALCIVCGMLVGAVVAYFLAKRRGIKPDIILDLMLFLVPLSIIGARVYYIIFELDSFIKDSFWETLIAMVNIRSGGLAIYGGIIGGAIAVFIVGTKIHKINYLKLADVCVPALILGQAIGRWGNFFNQEAYGNVVLNPKFFGLPFSVYIEEMGAYFQATFFYEFLWNSIGFILLFIFAWKYLKKANGLVMCGYFVWYGIGRTIIEGLRSDSLYWGVFRVSQVLSVLLVLAGLAFAGFLIYNYYFKSKNKNKIDIKE